MSRIRVGVVGVGHLGRHHARIFAGMPDVDLVAVADARIEQARSVAEPLGCRAVSSHLDLLGLVDAVSIAVPTSLHREVAGVFLERGIPALVEKPLAASVSEGEELVDLALRGGAMLQVGHIERFNPVLAALDQFPLRPKFISAERLGTYSFRSTDIGAVLDIMIHDLDLLLSWNDSPITTVSAVGVSVFGEHEDVANARLWFADGCVAELTASRVSYAATRKMRIWSAEGYATLDFAARKATIVRPSETLRGGRLDVDGLDVTQPAAVREHIFGKVLNVDHAQGDAGEPLALELADFIDSARTARRPRVTGEDGLRALQVADQILASLRAHQWEGAALGPVGPRVRTSLANAHTSAIPAPKLWSARANRGSVGKTLDKRADGNE